MADSALEIPEDAVASPLEWATDVMWASERRHLKTLSKTGGRPSKKCPPGVSQRRYGLWLLFKDDSQEMRALVPRALAIALKSTSRDDDEELLAAEEIDVAKMRAILDRALVEAAQ